MEKATFGSGCFWCTEAVFQRLKGVANVTSGYMGGHKDNPTYEEVCAGSTGHAEVVEVEYDPSVISFGELLEVFWKTHDPTTLNRQGNDVGTQYRSAIFYHSGEQQQQAEQMKNEMNAASIWPDPIVTEITPASLLFPAGDYHEDYFIRNGSQPYCTFVVRPKVEKMEKLFAEKLK